MRKIINLLVILALMLTIGCGGKGAETQDSTGNQLTSEEIDSIETELSQIESSDDLSLDADLESLDNDLDIQI